MDEVQRRVAEIVGRVLEDDRFAQEDADTDRSFLYRGVDSLKALELVAEIQEAFGLGPEEIPNTFVFDHPTIKHAAKAIQIAKGILPAASDDDGCGNKETGCAVGDSGTPEGSLGGPLAIVGIACRFPGGANSPDRFWENLMEGVDGVTEIPPSRLDIDGPSASSKMYVRKGALLSDRDVGEFDNGFFGIPTAEAAAMDPQQRLALHVAYEGFRAAGYDKAALSDMEAGVFVGNSAVEWSDAQAQATSHGVYGRSGTATAALANRVSHALGLRGASLTVDSSCSSSLVAVDLACQAVRQGRCPVAVAAGVQVHLSEKRWIQLCATNMLSLTERCRAFDASADGMVRGEGAAAVVVMPLERALAEGRPVYGTSKSCQKTRSP